MSLDVGNAGFMADAAQALALAAEEQARRQEAEKRAAELAARIAEAKAAQEAAQHALRLAKAAEAQGNGAEFRKAVASHIAADLKQAVDPKAKQPPSPQAVVNALQVMTTLQLQQQVAQKMAVRGAAPKLSHVLEAGLTNPTTKKAVLQHFNQNLKNLDPQLAAPAAAPSRFARISSDLTRLGVTTPSKAHAALDVARARTEHAYSRLPAQVVRGPVNAKGNHQVEALRLVQRLHDASKPWGDAAQFDAARQSNTKTLEEFTSVLTGTKHPFPNQGTTYTSQQQNLAQNQLLMPALQLLVEQQAPQAEVRLIARKPGSGAATLGESGRPYQSDLAVEIIQNGKSEKFLFNPSVLDSPGKLGVSMEALAQMNSVDQRAILERFVQTQGQPEAGAQSKLRLGGLFVDFSAVSSAGLGPGEIVATADVSRAVRGQPEAQIATAVSTDSMPELGIMYQFVKNNFSDVTALEVASYTHRKGDAPATFNSQTALSNEIGAAMKLPYDHVPVLPKDLPPTASAEQKMQAEADLEAVKRGDWPNYHPQGAAAKLIERIQNKVVEVGGQPTRMTAMPVFFNSQETGLIQLPLFRVKDQNPNNPDVFIDNTGRVYSGSNHASGSAFQDFLANNQLPPGDMLVPPGGHLGDAFVAFDNKGSNWDKTKRALHATAMVGGYVFAGAAVIGSGGTLMTVAGGALLAYNTYTSIDDIRDSMAHRQTMDPRDERARGQLLGLTANALALTGQMARMGGVLNQSQGYASVVAGLGKASDAVATAASLNDVIHIYNNAHKMTALELTTQCGQMVFWGALSQQRARANDSATRVSAPERATVPATPVKPAVHHQGLPVSPTVAPATVTSNAASPIQPVPVKPDIAGTAALVPPRKLEPSAQQHLPQRISPAPTRVSQPVTKAQPQRLLAAAKEPVALLHAAQPINTRQLKKVIEHTTLGPNSPPVEFARKQLLDLLEHAQLPALGPQWLAQLKERTHELRLRYVLNEQPKPAQSMATASGQVWDLTLKKQIGEILTRGKPFDNVTPSAKSERPQPANTRTLPIAPTEMAPNSTPVVWRKKQTEALMKTAQFPPGVSNEWLGTLRSMVDNGTVSVRYFVGEKANPAHSFVTPEGVILDTQTNRRIGQLENRHGVPFGVMPAIQEGRQGGQLF